MVRLIFFFATLFALISCKKEEVIFNAPPNENFELPLLLKLDGKNCAFDFKNGILKYSIEGDELENYAPLVEFQSHSEIRFEEIDLLNNKVNPLGNLALNTPYSITILTKGERNQFQLIFTDIPIVQIISHDPIENEPKTLSRFILNHPEKPKASDNNWAGIEHRGSSSLKFDKKSFEVALYTDISIETPLSKSYFGLKSNQSWVLNALFIDRSRLRNKVSFDLWTSLSGPANHIGIESRFVEVFVNHEAQGIFHFTESYTEQFLEMNSESVLYEGSDNSSTTMFEAFPDKNPNRALWGDWSQKHPEPKLSIVWDDFEFFLDLVVNGSDTEFNNTIGQIVDLDNIIDYYLFINLCNGKDNVGKNWYFFKQNPSDKFIILPWDLDGTWGRGPKGESVGHTSIVTNGLFKRLIESNPDNYRERLKNRWNELRMNEFSESNLSDLFDSNFLELEGYDIIGYENQLWGTDLDLTNEAIYIEGWVQDRLVFLDGQFQ